MKRFLFFFIFSQALFGQSTYQQHLTGLVANKIRLTCPKYEQDIDTFDCVIFGKKLALQKMKPAPAVGVSVFPKETYRFFSPELLDFIEREIAGYLFLKPAEWQKHSQTDKIFITDSLNQSLTKKQVAGIVSGIKNFKINRNKTNYQIELKGRNRQSLFLFFPASYRLISGLDKVKLQQKLFDELNVYDDNKLSFIPDTVALYPEKKLWVSQHKHYLIDDINNAVYYNTEKQLVFDPQYVEASLSNLFLTDLSTRQNKKALLNFHNYKTNKKLEKPLSKLLAFFDKNFEKYVGIEEINDKRIKALVLLVSKDYDFIHLLSVQLDKKALFEDDGTLNIELYSFIPAHNVKDFFASYKTN